jgi:hypothetical protein
MDQCKDRDRAESDDPRARLAGAFLPQDIPLVIATQDVACGLTLPKDMPCELHDVRPDALAAQDRPVLSLLYILDEVEDSKAGKAASGFADLFAKYE